MEDARKKVQISEIIVVLASVLVVAGLIIGIILRKNQQGRHDEQRKKIMAEIQTNLEKYFESEGSYPSDLQGLVPNYLKEIPSPIANNAWIYEPGNENQTYVLKVELESAQLTDDNVQEESGVEYYQLQSKQ